MYNDVYGDSIDGSKEVEEDSLTSNSYSIEELNTYRIK